jgi:MYXO-CTERM domain-containing protein
VTWTFTNGTECTPGGPASKTSPLPLPFLALGLAMLVAARRRAA